MDKIRINEILGFGEDELGNIRVKFNIFNGQEDPLELYKIDPDEVNINWFLWHDRNRYFKVGQLGICLLKIAEDIWLLTSVKKITALLDIDETVGGVGYEAEDVEKYRKYFGRVKIRYHKTSRTMGRRYESVMDELEVLEILNDQFTGDEFPGYENVRLTYPMLKKVVDRKLPGWYSALVNQKAVYLITDKATGKLYVGSATSKDGMLFARWSDYAANGHGENEGLKQLISEKGFGYVKDNFLYSILENYNARVDDEYILKRESWWKTTLRSREFGYNLN